MKKVLALVKALCDNGITQAEVPHEKHEPPKGEPMYYQHEALRTTCQNHRCDGSCNDAVRQESESGRWFITMGHPGYTSRGNSRGFATQAEALRTIDIYWAPASK